MPSARGPSCSLGFWLRFVAPPLPHFTSTRRRVFQGGRGQSKVKQLLLAAQIRFGSPAAQPATKAVRNKRQQAADRGHVPRPPSADKGFVNVGAAGY